MNDLATKTDLRKTKSRLIKWVVGATLGQTAVLVGAMALFL